MLLTSIAVVLFATQIGSTRGATGEPPEYWHNAAVVYAEVTGAEKEPEHSDGRYIIRLNPIATLAGTLDPAFSGELSTRAEIGFGQITEPPVKGNHVVALIELRREAHIPNGNVMFFPEIPSSLLHHRPAIFEVTSFDDPKVQETIENLRKLRGKQHKDAEKKAPTDPESKP